MKSTTSKGKKNRRIPKSFDKLARKVRKTFDEQEAYMKNPMTSTTTRTLREKIEEALYEFVKDCYMDIAVDKILQLIGERDKMVIGPKLTEADGWDLNFKAKSDCCPGDDYAEIGNIIIKEQRKRAVKSLK